MGRVARAGVRAAVLAALVVTAVVVVLVVDLPSADAVRDRVEGTGAVGLALVTLGVALALLGPVPRTALSLLLGAVLGFWAGVVASVVGAVLGGLAAFGLSRVLGREAVTRLAGPRVVAVDRALTGRGFVPLLVARVMPVPFSLTSYAAGLTGVPLGTYTAATALGVVPGSVLQVAVGASAGPLLGWATSPGGLLVEGVVVLLLVAGGVVWWRRRRSRSAPTS
ncbi:Uncharacterized membrane protein YdjX, TVP38/TMEM64 family, SNARE-associated domain [Geodermatophilus dictyosporus]|uniref:TVP38/TMEM64 family membrane protein n=1 Tax=Geodermatophilus dictyosporus TaxID=1523247 RepID=A0A1I5MVC5_9ACTN|nr:Uncharacterized membrane protein YdjX, TVP38/TMEM64 family, SNARE-associated domain [Geodermatophilus dictyosporus]